MERLDALSRGTPRTDLPAFDAGDTVRVMVRVREGDKERLQAFEGVVISRRGGGASENFTVRRIDEIAVAVAAHARHRRPQPQLGAAAIQHPPQR